MSTVRLTSPGVEAAGYGSPLRGDEEIMLDAGQHRSEVEFTNASAAAQEEGHGAAFTALKEGGAAAAPAKRTWLRKVAVIGVTAALLVSAAIITSRFVARSGSDVNRNDGILDELLGSNSYRVLVQPTYVHNLTLPPRLQWNENFGYCGSTSLIAAGMYFGTYVSQYDNRDIASNSSNQAKQSSQLLLGVNDYWAAHQHKLTNKLWNYDDLSTKHFLSWIKGEVLANHVVIMGVFENVAVFGNNPPDADYDHIVPVSGIGSNHPLTDNTYYDDDVIYFSDNGLYTPDDPDVSVYQISATFADFAKSRKDADSRTAGVYSINGAPTNTNPLYGISITGVVDEHDDTLPVSLTSDVNYEKPEITDGSSKRPTPMSMSMTARVDRLVVGQEYNLYYYNDFASVPASQFNGHASQASGVTKFTATATHFEKAYTVRTDEIWAFRAVLASAP